MSNSKQEPLGVVTRQGRVFRVVKACTKGILVVALAAAFILSVKPAYANSIPLGAATSYALLYTGTGGHNLQITNVTINGNVGVGGTGVVQFNGPGAINGNLDFSAAKASAGPKQFQNNNSANVGPTSVNYSVTGVTTALNTVSTLSSSLAGLGSNITISGNTIINESAGQLDTVNGVTYRVFNVTSYNENDGMVVTLNADGSGNAVVFNFGFNQNVNLGGDVKLNGLVDDQVLWNFTSSGQNIQLNNNASSFSTEAFQGVILAPNDKIQLTNANLDGRVFGGNSQDLQIASGTTINAPISAPEPESLSLLALGLVGLCLRVRQNRVGSTSEKHPS